MFFPSTAPVQGVSSVSGTFPAMSVPCSESHQKSCDQYTADGIATCEKYKGWFYTSNLREPWVVITDIFSSIKLLHTFWYREKNLLPRSTQIIAYRYLISLVTDCPMTDISPIYDKLTNGSKGLDSIVKDLNSVLIKHLVTSFDDQILHISLLLTYKYSWCLCKFIGKLYIKLDQMIMKSRPRLPYFGSKSKPRIVDKRAPPLFSHLSKQHLFQDSKASTDNAFTLFYGKFRANAPRVKSLMEQLEIRLDKGPE